MSEPLDSQVARHSEWIEGHEKRCEERYEGIKETVGEIKGTLKSWQNALWGVVVAIVGWMAVQIYTDLKNPPQPAYAPPGISDHP